ncbi:uncharacterized protein LOC130217536 [Danio aesculapii]|uniref:uncharacterized protein LOC130217536 n=1 Tax=Danio aesculapii TaxID=1142201 RepID=UPI0024BFC479|nr:uncharacterized protein LOC130217536 [Danio aesculapii]
MRNADKHQLCQRAFRNNNRPVKHILKLQLYPADVSGHRKLCSWRSSLDLNPVVSTLRLKSSDECGKPLDKLVTAEKRSTWSFPFSSPDLTVNKPSLLTFDLPFVKSFQAGDTDRDRQTTAEISDSLQPWFIRLPEPQRALPEKQKCWRSEVMCESRSDVYLGGAGKTVSVLQLRSRGQQQLVLFWRLPDVLLTVAHEHCLLRDRRETV